MAPQIPLWVILLLVLVPVSGFIAWAGDRVGHKVGKRRHSLFGLRPRHTATLFTIGSGVGISLVSLLLIWLGSAELRTVLSEGTRLVAVNRDLKDQNARLEADISGMRRTIEEAHGEAQQAEAARDRALKASGEAAAAATRARDDLSAARSELTRARGSLSSARKEIAAASSRLDAARSLVADARAQLGKTRGRLNDTEDRLTDAQGRLRSARARYEQAEKRAALAETRRTQAEKLAAQASDAAADAQKKADDITAQARTVIAMQEKNLLDQKAVFDSETKKQRDELRALADEVQSLEAKRFTLQQALGYRISREVALRRSPITYRIGEEVERLALPGSLSIWRVQTALEGLMASAAKKAQSRGAAPSGGVGRAVYVPEVRVPDADAPTTPAAEGGGPRLRVAGTEADAIRAAADAIRKANQDVVVILTAANNAVAGEPVEVELKTYRNPVVLRSGVKVGELTLENVATRQEAADTLYAFLRGDVRRRLLDAGIIPPAEGATVPGDEEEDAGSIVSLSGDEWLRIMDGVRKAGPRSRVVVKTAADLRAADPVRLTFEIKSLPVPPPDSSPAAQTGPSMPSVSSVRP